MSTQPALFEDPAVTARQARDAADAAYLNRWGVPDGDAWRCPSCGDRVRVAWPLMLFHAPHQETPCLRVTGWVLCAVAALRRGDQDGWVWWTRWLREAAVWRRERVAETDQGALW